jgi:hypothetical protein
MTGGSRHALPHNAGGLQGQRLDPAPQSVASVSEDRVGNSSGLQVMRDASRGVLGGERQPRIGQGHARANRLQ